MDCSPSGSSVHGISQARILEWVAISFSKGSSRPGGWTQVSCIAGRFWATREAWSRMDLTLNMLHSSPALTFFGFLPTPSGISCLASQESPIVGGKDQNITLPNLRESPSWRFSHGRNFPSIRGRSGVTLYKDASLHRSIFDPHSDWGALLVFVGRD